MSVAGPVEQAAALTQGLSVGRVGAGAQGVAVLPAAELRPAGPSNAPVGSSAASPVLERRRDGLERPTERLTERQATPFFAQLLAQSAEPLSGADAEAQRLAGRRQPSRLAVEDPAAEAQKRRGGARRGDDPEASAGAYERVKLSAREFAARRYGVARDADGVVFFQATSIDIKV